MMRLSITRRWVTGVSVCILLLCQTMAAALAYVAAPAAASAIAAAAAAAAAPAPAPCHDAQSADGTTPSNSCHDRCPSRDAAFETAKINIPVAAGFALSAFIVDPPRGIITAGARYQRIVATAAPPPPLRLVYCRLLN